MLGQAAALGRVASGEISGDGVSENGVPTASEPAPVDPSSEIDDGDSLGDLGRRGELPATARGAALELAMRIGDLLQSSGQSANDTVVVIRRVCQAYGLRRVQVDITSTSIVGSYLEPTHQADSGGTPSAPGRLSGQPVTSMRMVEPTHQDLAKTAALNRLVSDVVKGESLPRAMERFDQIRAARRPYPGWVATLGNASIGMAVQLLHTTNPVVLAVALVMGIALNRLLDFLARRSMPVFFQQLAGGWLIVVVTAATSWAGTWEWTPLFHGLAPTLIAVGGVVQLVAGMKFVSAGQDAIDGFYLTATARLLQVIMLTAGIVAGLVSGLTVAARFGFFIFLSSNIPTNPMPLRYAAVILAGVCFMVGAFADWQTIVLTAGGSALAWFGFTASQAAIGGTVTPSFIGALLSAVVVTMLVRRTSKPGFAIVNGALIGLVPGMRLYNGLLQMVGTNVVPADPSQGGSALLVAAGVALALAAGASLGIYIGRPVGDRIMKLPQTWIRRLAA